MTTSGPPRDSRDLRRITDREKAFYDEAWLGSELKIVEEPLCIPGVSRLDGKELLICGCGVGVEAVRAARAGARVSAFDISPVAIERTKQLASMNSVQLSASVMDFHHLGYPSDSFDIAYGEYILHHVDCGLAGRELLRVLKPSGVAYFIENSDANQLIMWFRGLLFGGSGTCHRQRFLFVKRIGTVDEDPLSADEIGVFRDIFGGDIRVENPDLLFFNLIAKHIWDSRVCWKVTAWLDRIIATVVPSSKRYSFSRSIWLRKPSLQGDEETTIA